MADNILKKIINKKLQRLDKLKKEISIEDLNEKISQNNNYIDFKLSIDKDFFNKSIFFSLFLIIFSSIFSGTLNFL